MWGSFLESSPHSMALGVPWWAGITRGDSDATLPFAPALQGPQEGQHPLWLGTELSECSIPREGRPSRQAGRDPELCHRVSPAAWLWGEVKGEVPGVGKMRTLFGFVQREGGKQPSSSGWSVEVSDGGVYFGRLMAGIELCHPRHVRINHPLFSGSAMISSL